jgi:hypothetical protein
MEGLYDRCWFDMRNSLIPIYSDMDRPAIA